MVTVTSGTLYIPVVNVGEIDMFLYPRYPIGLLSQVQIVSLGISTAEHVRLGGVIAMVSTQDAKASAVTTY